MLRPATQAVVEPSDLLPPLRGMFGSDHVTAIEWSRQVPPGTAIVDSQPRPWSLIRKRFQALKGRDAVPANRMESPSGILYWTREHHMYQSGLLDGLPDGGDILARLDEMRQHSIVRRGWPDDVVFVHYCQHRLPCPEGIEIGRVIWDQDQVPARGIEQVAAWYAGSPAKASACVQCGVCVERCPFDVEIIGKMHEAAALFEGQAA